MKLFRRPFAILAALVLTAVVGCAATPTRESTGQFVDDAAITTKVKAAIVNEKALSSFDIHVETYRGRVQLSGFVSSQDSIDRASAVARGVSGVESVINDLRLR